MKTLDSGSRFALYTMRCRASLAKKMFTQRADTVEEAVAMALAKHGKNAKIILMKNGSDMIPRFEGKPENA